jgi:dTMP kinase
MVKAVHRVAVGEIQPDLTLLIDVDLKTARQRVGASKHRLESLPIKFHQRVRNGFLEIARKEKRRVKMIDGQPSAEIVFASVKKLLDKKLSNS